MQRIAVEHERSGQRARAAATCHVVDLMCDPRVLEPSSFSGDGFHPSDRGYALMAELAYPAMVNASHPGAGRRLRPEAPVPALLTAPAG